MAVHVDEVHTDVVPAVLPSTRPSGEHPPERIGVADDMWRESHRAALMISRRTAAQAFDD
jgi:hypothetical protein